jgi:ABC-type Co2+ transport system permease subunit
MVMEGIITIFIIEFVRRVRPEMLRDISSEASR